MDRKDVFEGVAKTLEDAIEAAHGQVRSRAGKDFTLSRVIEFGMQFGGLLPERLFYVKVVEDHTSEFKTEHRPTGNAR